MANLSEGARYRAALRVLQAKLVGELAADDDDTGFISGEAELLVLALLCVLRVTPGMPADSEALRAIRDGWFESRPWYHRVAIDVAVQLAARERFSGEFYVNLWVRNSSIRQWLVEVAWIVREHLDPLRAVAELGRNVENWNLASWPGLLRWLIERHGRLAIRTLEDYEPLYSLAEYQKRLTRFFAHPEDDDVKELQRVEAEAMERVRAALAVSGQSPPPEPNRVDDLSPLPETEPSG